MEAASSKTIYLHIGSSKTGSSALQYFLLQNRSLLREKGFDYPPHDVDPNGISSGNGQRLGNFLIDGDMAQAESLVSEIMRTAAANIILSSELLYFLEDENVVRLKSLLSSADVRVIIYLRRQESMLESVYQQHVKRRGDTRRMEAWFSEHYRDARYSHDQLRTWAAVFGKDAIAVRPYESQQFRGGTIFSDFLCLLGLSLMSEFSMPSKSINPSYRADALEAMRLFNLLPLAHRPRLQDVLLQRFSESRGKAGDWPYKLMSPAQRILVCEYYADTNAAIARDTAGREDGRLFYDSLPAADEAWAPYPGLSAQAVGEITTYIARHSEAVSRLVGHGVRLGLQSEDAAVREAAQTLKPGLKVFRAAMLRGRVVGLLRRIYHVIPEKIRNPIKVLFHPI